ncbi:hypothetical protein [Trichloromonas sp.]|uniref:hypothetical protein n=1 Tax=Trichloromonas sp. TaxID=3069249 RepID=UPI002A44FB0F|nr:hypothetical protein [Trichloromonas sp.]
MLKSKPQKIYPAFIRSYPTLSCPKKGSDAAFVRLFLCGSVANCFSATDAHGQHRTKAKKQTLLQPTKGTENTDKIGY